LNDAVNQPFTDRRHMPPARSVENGKIPHSNRRQLATNVAAARRIMGPGARRANVSAPSDQNISVASTRSANQDSMLGTHSTNFRTAPAMNEDSRENGSSGPVLGIIFTALALAILLMA
jgi:hypothetical protein